MTDDSNEINNSLKQRNGFVTAWLILMIIFNSLFALFYFLAVNYNINSYESEDSLSTISNSIFIILGIIGLANVIFSILILKWNKIGFWGFAITSIITLIVNLNIGMDIGKSLVGLLGVMVLYFVLQIKKNNKTAWENLD